MRTSRVTEKHPPAKQVDCKYGDDNTPQWDDRLKNQMGYAAASNLAREIHTPKNGVDGRGTPNSRQRLIDLGVKGFTENDQAEAVQNRLSPEKNEPK